MSEEQNTRPAPTSATLPDLGPEFVAAREKLRATVDQLMTDGSMGCDPLKCMAVAATALLGQMSADRDRLAAELKRLNSLLDCAKAVMRIDVCDIAPEEDSSRSPTYAICEDDECVYCRSVERLDAHFDGGAADS